MVRNVITGDATNGIVTVMGASFDMALLVSSDREVADLAHESTLCVTMIIRALHRRNNNPHWMPYRGLT